MNTPEPAQDGIHSDFLVRMYSQDRLRSTLLILGLVVIFIAVVIVGTITQAPLPDLDTSKIGVHFLLDDGRNRWPIEVWAEHFAYADRIAAEGGIAVQVIRADDLNAERWQPFMELAAQHNLTPVLRLATTFDFERNVWNAPASDPSGNYTSWGERYAAFINALDWPTDDKHIILLNEPNNGHEWGGTPDPVAYAQFVSDVAPILRDQVEHIVILNAAFDLYVPHTGGQPFPGSDVASIDANTFMEAMQAAQPDIFAQFDIWNSHPYPEGAFIDPPWVQTYRFDFMAGAPDAPAPPPDGIFNRGINGYEWELWKLAQFGIEDISVMITETGWRHSDSVRVDSVDAGSGYPDAALMANFIDAAFKGRQSRYAATREITWTPWLADERVIGIAPFALNGVPDEWSHSNWLRLDPDGRVIGTYAPFDLVERYFDEDQ